MGKRHLPLFVGGATVILFLAFLLNACSKSSSSPTGPGGAGGVITVTGKVYGINNQPVAGVPVLITGLPSVNTDANGSFTIATVPTPYSIVVVDGANNRALVYRGLTRADPNLYWPGSTPGTPRAASASGFLIPAPPTTGVNARVVFVSPEAAGSSSVSLGNQGSFTVSPAWYGPTTTTGNLYALVWNIDGNNLPTTYTKFGKRSGVTLLDGTTNQNQNDTLGTAQTAQVTGTVNVPTGYTLASRALSAVFESKGGLTLLSENAPVPNFTYNTPNVSGATLSIIVAATKSTGEIVQTYVSGLAVNATGVTVTVPAAPELSLPVNHATGVSTGSPFSWTALTGGVHLVEFSPAVAGQPRLIVITTATSDSIPDLSSAGLTLPKSANYSWLVEAVAPFASIDAAAGPAGIAGFVTSPSSYTGSYARTTTRTFTTAP